MFDFGRETSRIIDRTIDLEAVTFADDKVVVTVARCSMNTAGSCFAVRLLLSFTDVEFGFRISLTAKRHMVTDHQ